MREDFWQDVARHRYPSGASEELIAEVQVSLGVRLPEAYIQVMRIQNGGYLSRCVYQSSSSESKDDIEDAYYLCNDPMHKLEKLELLTEPHGAGWDIHVAGLEFLVSFMQGGARFWCFDYRDCGPQSEPAILYVNAELEEEIPVAASCEFFFDNLHAGPE